MAFIVAPPDTCPAFSAGGAGGFNINCSALFHLRFRVNCLFQAAHPRLHIAQAKCLPFYFTHVEPNAIILHGYRKCMFTCIISCTRAFRSLCVPYNIFQQFLYDTVHVKLEILCKAIKCAITLKVYLRDRCLPARNYNKRVRLSGSVCFHQYIGHQVVGGLAYFVCCLVQ